MHAFIVRPFGEKKGIDFDRVERELIMPVLRDLGFSGGTTAEIVEQGNIRSDMFEELLLADLVIADISIHNANVFYELGIRHALRNRHTFLIRCSTTDEVPFDLKTDRYLQYDATDPSASCDKLSVALHETWLAKKKDSPLFLLLPHLQDICSSPLHLVPSDFQEALQQALSRRDGVLLELMAAELDGIPWKSAALRLVGESQRLLKEWRAARITWNAVLEYDDLDVQANSELATVYDRLCEPCLADQAVERALHNRDRSLSADRLAELHSLSGRNAKTRWRREWESVGNMAERQRRALCSSCLSDACNKYRRGFSADRNHYYSGLNALAMLTILVELAAKHPETWTMQFRRENEAIDALKAYREYRGILAAGVRLALESSREEPAGQQAGCDDVWLQISEADHSFLTGENAGFIALKYQQLLSRIGPFYCESAIKQIELFRDLSIFPEKTEAVLQAIRCPAPEPEKASVPVRAILFTGHRIDAPGRTEPRFPAGSEARARAMIREAVVQEQRKADGMQLVGISGAASGGDILFLEICEELAIPVRIQLAVPAEDYIRESVADSGYEWVERFEFLVRKHPPEILCREGRLPLWLRSRREYNVWQRSNLWMLFLALKISDNAMTLIALWDGAQGDGPGGTSDMVNRARDRGAKIVHLDAGRLTLAST